MKDKCKPGTYGNATGRSNVSIDCYVCEKGFSCLGGDSRKACPVGRFSSHEGLVKNCTLCPRGKYGTGLAQIQEANACQTCRKGTYCPGGEKGEIDCPLDYFGRSTGFSSMSECEACPEGRYGVRTALHSATDCNISEAYALLQQLQQTHEDHSDGEGGIGATEISNILENDRIDTKDTKNTVGLVNAITKNPKQVNPKAQAQAMSLVSTALEYATGQGKPVPSAVLESCATAASNILDAASAADTKEDSESGSNTEQSPEDQAKARVEAKQVADKISKVVGQIAILQASSMKPGETLTIKTPQLELKTSKKNARDMRTKVTTAKVGSAAFAIPAAVGNTFDEEVSSIDVAVVGWGKNPYRKLSSSTLNSGVISMTLRSGNDEIIVSNLADPIQIKLPRTLRGVLRRRLSLQPSCSSLAKVESGRRMAPLKCPTYVAIVYYASAVCSSLAFFATTVWSACWKHSDIQFHALHMAQFVFGILAVFSILGSAFVCSSLFSSPSRVYESSHLILVFGMVLTGSFVVNVLAFNVWRCRKTKLQIDDVWQYVRYVHWAFVIFGVPLFVTTSYVSVNSRLYSDWLANDVSFPSENQTCSVVGIRNESVSYPECKFWDKNETGGEWSTSGCTTILGEEDDTTVTCKCNHLTDFAVAITKTQVRLEIIALDGHRNLIRNLDLPLYLSGGLMTIITLLLMTSILDTKHKRRARLQARSFLAVFAMVKLKRKWLISRGVLSRLSHLPPLRKKRRESILLQYLRKYALDKVCTMFWKDLCQRHDILQIVLGKKSLHLRRVFLIIFATRIISKGVVMAIFFELKAGGKGNFTYIFTWDQLALIAATWFINKLFGGWLKYIFKKQVMHQGQKNVNIYKRVGRKNTEKSLVFLTRPRMTLGSFIVWAFTFIVLLGGGAFLLLFGFQLKQETDTTSFLFLRCWIISICTWQLVTTPLRSLFEAIKEYSRHKKERKNEQRRAELVRTLNKERMVKSMESGAGETHGVELTRVFSMDSRSDWAEALDEESGRRYYYSRSRNISQWDRPREYPVTPRERAEANVPKQSVKNPLFDKALDARRARRALSTDASPVAKANAERGGMITGKGRGSRRSSWFVDPGAAKQEKALKKRRRSRQKVLQKIIKEANI